MPTLTPLQVLLALVCVCAAVVRLWGWKAGGAKGWVLAAVFAYALYKLQPAPHAPALAAALLATAVFVWRDLPRNTMGMALAPDRRRVPETLAFNLAMLAPVFVVRILAYDVAVLDAVVRWLALAAACTALAYLHHRLEPYAGRTGRDVNAFIELACGAGLGLALI